MDYWTGLPGTVRGAQRGKGTPVLEPLFEVNSHFLLESQSNNYEEMQNDHKEKKGPQRDTKLQQRDANVHLQTDAKWLRIETKQRDTKWGQ